MGCFVGYCIVSGLPITYGEKVKFLLIQEDNLSHVKNMWQPRTIPIDAIYDDYGSIEGWEEGRFTDLILSELKKDLIEKPIGENKYHEPAVTKDMEFGDLLGCLWEERVEVKAVYPPGANVKICQAMIRKDIYDGLVKLPCELRDGGNLRIEDLEKSLTKEIDISKAVYSKSIKDYSRDELSFWLNDHRREIGRDQPYKSVLYSLEDLTPAEIRKITEFVYIKRILDRLSFRWQPKPSIGTQDDPFELHKKFNSLIVNVSRDVIKKQKEEYGG